MSNKGLERFRQIAEAIYKSESRYRPGLRKASAAFREGCLAMLASAARECAAKYRGRRDGRVNGKRVPVSEIAAKFALSQFRKFLAVKKIYPSTNRREVFEVDASEEDSVDTREGGDVLMSDAPGIYGRADTRVEFNAEDAVAEGVTAVALHGGDTRGGYEAGAVTEARSKRSRGSPPGTSEGSRRMTRAADSEWRDMPLGSNFINKYCTLASGHGWKLVIPSGPWQQQRAVNRRWRLLRGEAGSSPVVSLLDENVEKLFAVEGTVVQRNARRTVWATVFARRSLLDI